MLSKLQSPQTLYQFEPEDYGLKTISKKNKTREPHKRFRLGSSFSKEDRKRLVLEANNSGISIEELCDREGISVKTLQDWSRKISNEELLQSYSGERVIWSQDEKFKIVLEGRSGESSVAEICNREKIQQETFLKWVREFLEYRHKQNPFVQRENTTFHRNKELVRSVRNTEIFDYLSHFIDFSEDEGLIVSKGDSLRLENADSLKSVVCLQRVNDIRYINKFFEKVNEKMIEGGMFAGCLETFAARRNRKAINNVPVVRDIYFSIEFLFKRILPKLSWTKKYYFDITKGNDRLLSKAEGLGRLVSCGFQIIDFRHIDGLLYFVVKKVKEPVFDESPSYGPLYKMPRLGKNGKIIKVYKFRTMHPYSEYLQDFIVKANGYAHTGKPANDFRIPKWGKFFRRFWLDELPQLINLVKGEVKLVGIRPVSPRYFQDIPKEMQKLRLTQKPGCIPPYVSLNRDGNVMSVLQAEKEYLEEKIRNPYFTDLKFFFSAIFNIVFRHKRSA